MANSKIIKLSYSLKPIGTSFNSLIEQFISEDFVLTKDNVLNFFKKLHQVDFENKFSSIYTIKTVDDILYGGYADHINKEIALNINNILNIREGAKKETVLALKIQLLCAYFHESKHEHQYNLCSTRGLTSGAYNKVLTFELLNGGKVYNQFTSLIEIDARVYSIKRIVELQKQGVLPFIPQAYGLLLEDILQIFEGVNNTTESSYSTYAKNPFSSQRVLEKILMEYKEDLNENTPIKYNFDDVMFVEKFKKEFNNIIGDFFNNEYRFFMFNNAIKLPLYDKLVKQYKLTEDGSDMQWVQIFFENILVPKRNHLTNFTFIQGNEIRNDGGIIEVIESDVYEFLKYKNIEITERNIAEFYNDDEMHKEFEEFLRNKNNENNVLNGYNALLNAILGEKEN